MALAMSPARPLPLALIALALVALTSVLIATLGIVAGAAVPIAMLAVAAFPLTRRWRPFPLVLVIAASATAALTFLHPQAQFGQERTGNEELLSYGRAMGPAVAFAAILAVTSGARLFSARSRSLDALMVTFAVLGAYLISAGLLRGNDHSLVFRDGAKYLVLPAVYFITMASVHNLQHMRSILVALIIALCVQQIRNVPAVFDIITRPGTPRALIILWIQLLIGALACVLIALDERRPSRRVLLLYVATGLFALGLFAGIRTYIGIGAVLMVLPVLIRPQTIRRLPRFGFAATPVALTIIIVLLAVTPLRGVFALPVNILTDRIGLVLTGTDDYSAYHRSREPAVIWGELHDDPFLVLAGKGAGATFRLPPDLAPALGSYESFDYYYVHINYVSAFLRGGLIGLASLIALYIVGLRTSLRLTRLPGALAWFPFLTIAAFFAATPFFSMVPGDLTFSIAIGLTGAMLRFEEP